MRYRTILDNTMLLEGDDQPMGMNDISTSIVRDRGKKGVVINRDVRLEFVNKGYDYLHNKFYNSGYCTEVLIDIEYFKNNAWKSRTKGILKLKDVEHYRWKNTISVKVSDNNYSSRIDNNKNIEDYPFGGRSKNGVEITPAANYRVTFFDPADGILNFPPDLTYKNVCYRAYELLRWMTAYMSDGEVGFRSDFYDIGGEREGFVLGSGFMARHAKSSGLPEDEFKAHHPKLSWEKLFTELHKKHNLAFKIEIIAGVPTLRVEPATEYFGQDTGLNFENIDKVTTSILAEELYSVLKIGSRWLNESEMDASTLTFPSSEDFQGFKREDWTIAGQCNEDRPLDLQGNFITDSNLIEDIMGFNDAGDVNKGYDLDWIFFETTLLNITLGEAVVGNPFQDGRFCYNPNLRNAAVLQNFYGFVPNSIVQYLSQLQTGLFFYRRNSGAFLNSSITWTQINPQTLVFDEGSGYDPLTGEVTIINPGQYTFRSGHIFFGAFFQWFFGCKIERWIGGVFSQEVVNLTTETNAGFVGPDVSATFNCDAGDVIKFYVFALSTGPSVVSSIAHPMSWVECSASPDGGGIYFGSDPANYPSYLNSFDYPLTFEEKLAIEADPIGEFTFSMNGEQPQKGYINKIRYKDDNSDLANIQLISTQSQNATQSTIINPNA